MTFRRYTYLKHSKRGVIDEKRNSRKPSSTRWSENKKTYICTGGLSIGAVCGCLHVIGRASGASQIVVTDVANVKLYMVADYLQHYRHPGGEQHAEDIPVRCPELKRAFNSMSDAAREVGARTSDISKHVAGKNSHVKGYTFEEIQAERFTNSREKRGALMKQKTSKDCVLTRSE